VEGYGSTEAGAVFVDGVIRRPPVIDYKLVDVAELGYYGTDVAASPRRAAGQVRSALPRLHTSDRGHREVFDADGYYGRVTSSADLGPTR